MKSIIQFEDENESANEYIEMYNKQRDYLTMHVKILTKEMVKTE